MTILVCVCIYMYKYFNTIVMPNCRCPSFRAAKKSSLNPVPGTIAIPVLAVVISIKIHTNIILTIRTSVMFSTSVDP